MGRRQRSELCVQLRAVDSAPDVCKLAFFKNGIIFHNASSSCARAQDSWLTLPVICNVVVLRAKRIPRSHQSLAQLVLARSHIACALLRCSVLSTHGESSSLSRDTEREARLIELVSTRDAARGRELPQSWLLTFRISVQ